jgi:predicted enzyme related to lactoylglutathione lyase
VLMDMGWIVTLGAGAEMPVQLSVASEGGGGAPVPHLSIEVDDVTQALARVEARGAEVIYPLTQEPWGVKRFFVRDPGGRILNVLSHI